MKAKKAIFRIVALLSGLLAGFLITELQFRLCMEPRKNPNSEYLQRERIACTIIHRQPLDSRGAAGCGAGSVRSHPSGKIGLLSPSSPALSVLFMKDFYRGRRIIQVREKTACSLKSWHVFPVIFLSGQFIGKVVCEQYA